VGAPASVPPCPFCEGHETDTPPEVYADRPVGSRPDVPGWRVRVFANLFPALDADAGPGGKKHGQPDLSRPAAGVHEVLVHSPDHTKTLTDLTPGGLTRVLTAVQARTSAHLAAGWGSVLTVVNQGRRAGASLQHPHAQIFATPEVPPLVASEVSASKTACAVCDLVARERRARTRLVAGDDRVAVICPFASHVPFEQLVVPIRHQPAFQEAPEAVLRSAAAMIQEALGRLAAAAGAPDYNLVLHTSPRSAVGHFHWHLHVYPRLTVWGGFELGAGTIINTLAPEDAAERLRGVVPS